MLKVESQYFIFKKRGSKDKQSEFRNTILYYVIKPDEEIGGKII